MSCLSSLFPCCVPRKQNARPTNSQAPSNGAFTEVGAGGRSTSRAFPAPRNEELDQIKANQKMRELMTLLAAKTPRMPSTFSQPAPNTSGAIKIKVTRLGLPTCVMLRPEPAPSSRPESTSSNEFDGFGVHTHGPTQRPRPESVTSNNGGTSDSDDGDSDSEVEC